MLRAIGINNKTSFCSSSFSQNQQGFLSYRNNLAGNRRNVSNKFHKVLKKELRKVDSVVRPSQFKISNVTPSDILEGKRDSVQRQFEMYKQGFERPMVEKFKTVYEERMKEKNRRDTLDYYKQTIETGKLPQVGELSILPENASQLLFNTLSIRGKEEKFLLPIAKLGEAERLGLLRDPTKTQLKKAQLMESEIEMKALVDEIESVASVLEAERQRDEKIKDEADEDERLMDEKLGDEEMPFSERFQNAVRLEEIASDFINRFEAKNNGRQIDLDLLKEYQSILQEHIAAYKQLETNKETDISLWSDEEQANGEDRLAEFFEICEALEAICEEKGFESLGVEIRGMDIKSKKKPFGETLEEYIALGSANGAKIQDPVLGYIHHSFPVIEAREAIRRMDKSQLQEMLLEMRKKQILDSDSGEVENILFSKLGLQSPFPGGKFTPQVKEQIKNDRKAAIEERKKEIERIWPSIEITNPFNHTLEDSFNPLKMLPQETEVQQYLQILKLPQKGNQDDLLSGEKEEGEEEDESVEDIQNEDEDDESIFEKGSTGYNLLKSARSPMSEEEQEQQMMKSEEGAENFDGLDERDDTITGDEPLPDEDVEEERLIRNEDDDDFEDYDEDANMTLVQQYGHHSVGKEFYSMKRHIASAVIPHELYTDEGYDPFTAQIGLPMDTLREAIKEELTDCDIELKGPEVDLEKQYKAELEEKLLYLMNRSFTEIDEGFHEILSKYDEPFGEETPEPEFKNVPHRDFQMHHDEYASSIPKRPRGETEDDEEYDPYTEDSQSEFNAPLDVVKNESHVSLFKQQRTQAMDPYHGMNITSQGSPVEFGKENPIRISYVKEQPSAWKNDRYSKLRMRKARLDIHIPSLNLSQAALLRLHELANERIKGDLLRIIVSKDMETHENIYYAKKIAQHLLEESWKADPSFVPYSNNSSYVEEQTEIDVDHFFNEKTPKQQLNLFHFTN
eukprot:TRINITY_DN2177_c0_g1_i1.p1 TRINITY_DN2177_c0_g1~~TRINITY_DN2177_c0_g1_i1.p1  ORF type:complete len:965 (+),score=344.61 TRINITY_DN2177_c0_g1_i1:162-3056(+)